MPKKPLPKLLLGEPSKLARFFISAQHGVQLVLLVCGLSSYVLAVVNYFLLGRN